MRAWLALLAGFVIALPSHAQKTASFPTEDGGVIFADIYGHGDNAVVLAHGGQQVAVTYTRPCGCSVKYQGGD